MHGKALGIKPEDLTDLLYSDSDDTDNKLDLVNYSGRTQPSPNIIST